MLSVEPRWPVTGPQCLQQGLVTYGPWLDSACRREVSVAMVVARS